MLNLKNISVEMKVTDLAKFLLQSIAGAAMLVVAFQAHAETSNNIDLRETSGFVPAAFATTTLTELFKTQRNNQGPLFWVKVTVTETATGRETISIKSFPSSRFESVKTVLKRVPNMRKNVVYENLNLCDSGSRAVRFKDKRQTVIDICGFSAGNTKKVSGPMLRVINKLQQLRTDTKDLPDTVYVVPGN